MSNNTAQTNGFIIEIIKNSRVKYNAAQKGEILYVVHIYENSWGTEKFIGINGQGDERIATIKSIRFVKPNEEVSFNSAKALQLWVEKTHIPFIFNPRSKSKNGNSHKCSIVGVGHHNWVAARLIRNDAGNLYSEYELNVYQSGYIPLWYAKKLSLIHL